MNPMFFATIVVITGCLMAAYFFWKNDGWIVSEKQGDVQL